MEARGPDPLRDQIFRSQPELARRLEEHAELLTAERALVSAPQTRRFSEPALEFLTPRHPLRHGAAASFLASLSPLLFGIWISLLFWSCLRPLCRGISCSPISVSVSVCGDALILVTRLTLASLATHALPLPLLQIFSPALLYEGAGIPVRLAIHYRRPSTLLLQPLLWGLA